MRRASARSGTRDWIARASFGLVAIVTAGFLALVSVYFASERALTRRHAPSQMEPSSSRVVSDGLGANEHGQPVARGSADSLERGRHLVTVVAQCTHCHGPDLAGTELADDPWIGRLSASNLTTGEGGVGGRLSDADWVAALRQGVNREGRALLLMPSAQLAALSDRDLEAIVAYVRQVPAVDRVWPERRVGWLTRVVVVAGLAPDLIAAEQVAEAALRDERASGASGARGASEPHEVLPAATIEYGEYLVALGSCRVCHRADLEGGRHPLSLPGEPVPPALTGRGAIGDWSRADFERTMRSGKTPDGRVLDRAFMPWPAFAGLSELEIDALWRYLESLRGAERRGRLEETDVASGEDGWERG